MLASEPSRPAFIESLSREYYARLARCLVLSGNIYDLFPVYSAEEGSALPRDPGKLEFVSLERRLQYAFSHAKNRSIGEQLEFIVLTLKSNGISFLSVNDKNELLAAAKAGGLNDELAMLVGEIEKEKSSSFVAITLIGELLRAVAKARSRGVPIRPLGIIIDHANTLFPNAEISRLASLDREVFKYFYDLLREENLWADEATAADRPDLLVLLTPALADLNKDLLALPKVVSVQVGLPDEATRRAFAETRCNGIVERQDYGVNDLVSDSCGLTLRTLDDLITGAKRDPERLKIDRAHVVKEVNRQIGLHLSNIVEIVYPDHGLNDLIGFSRLKARLTYFAKEIDNPRDAPSGITVVGPNGAGKTFMFEGFAKDCGRVVVKFGGIRGEFYGETDKFMEMFESVLSAFGRILILVDEADTAFGSIHGRDTHETEKRLAGNILQMMDNASYRGKILWVLITARPHLLAPDMTRAGRCSLFMPVFDPEGEDADAFINWAVNRLAQEGTALNHLEVSALREKVAQGFSAGDYREFVSAFLREKRFDPSTEFEDFIEHWIPSAVGLGQERELQTLLAALKCDWPDLLPERFRDISRTIIQQKADALKVSMGY